MASTMSGASHIGEYDKQSVSDRARGTKHLSYQELIDRRTKGLCFRCDEKFHPMHQCTECLLKLIIMGDEDEAEVRVLEVEDGGLKYSRLTCQG